MNAFDPTTPGIYADVPASIYHAANNAVSCSMLDLMNPPARLKAKLDAKEEQDDPTEAMLMGTFVHQRILEPSCPLPKLAVPPEKYPVPEGSSLVKAGKVAVGDLVPWHGAATYCKEWRKAQEAAGKTVVTREFYDSTASCVEAIRADKDCQRIFRKGKGELTVIAPYTSANGEILRRCRIDWLPDESTAIVDVKKVAKGKAAKKEFAKLIATRRYHVRACAYLNAWNTLMGKTDPRTSFVFVVVEDEAPYLVARYYLDIRGKFIARGRQIHFSELEQWSECRAKDHWPGYDSGIVEIQPEEWMVRED